MNVIFGAGGFAKEVSWLYNELIISDKSTSPIDALVVDDESNQIGGDIFGAPIISESDFFIAASNTKCNIYIAIGNNKIRKEIQNKCKDKIKNAKFPALIHPSVCFDKRPGAVSIGDGTIICAGVILTTNISIGEFVHINLSCTIGHDAVIGNFTTISPGVHVSGKSKIDKECFIGTNATILENLSIPAFSIIGAGATVVKNIDVPGTYVGTPAKLIHNL